MRNNADVRVRNGAWSWVEGVLVGCGMTALLTGSMCRSSGLNPIRLFVVPVMTALHSS